MVTMKETTKYFNNKDEECLPEHAFKIVQHTHDDNGILIEEQIFFKAFP